MRTDGIVARLEGASRCFGSGPAAVEALAEVDLELREGELTVVVGPSGSGKTTLLNLVGGIERPSAGRVVVGGRDLSQMGSDELTEVRRETVGFVFQVFNLIPTLTAHENVALVAELTDGGRAEERADRALADVGLTGRGDHFPSQLSGGEQQRVAVARALVNQPTLLLCDEPTGALDVDTGRRILALLEAQARTAGRAVTIVTHNLAIAPMADRVLRLRAGRIEDDVHNPSPTPAGEVDW